MSKEFCLDLSYDDILSWCKENGFPSFRAKQVFSWLNSGIIDSNLMTNIPKGLRDKLEEDFYMASGMTEILRLKSQVDGTTKHVYRLSDGNTIESVVMRYKTGLSICISSQAGCKMGCAFCASAKAGFGRSLTAGEMLGQVLVTGQILGEKIRTVVIMGIGEPFDNYDNLVSFISKANNPDGPNIGARHITVSTCGLIPKIKAFTKLKLQVNLAISLHAPFDDMRLELMPVASVYSIRDLIDSVKEYIDYTGRRVTFEYSLFNEINDTLSCADELQKLLKGINAHVNLIAANEFPGSPYKRSSEKRIQVFKKRLEENGINVTRRREMGTDIMAACGQLRRGIENK